MTEAKTLKIRVYITAAFCKDGGGGNKAGVVFDRPELTREQKMRISAGLGFSETAFVTASSSADHKLEYFTPTEEVDLCGHATVATFATLKALGRLKKPVCTIETKAGIQEIRVSEDGLVLMQQNLPAYFDLLPREKLLPSLGEAAHRTLPAQIISTGLKDIIAPVEDLNALADIQPDFEAITALSLEKDVTGIHAFAVTPEDPERDAVCRNFAPACGIPEESATGTANCALASYFYTHLEKKDHYCFEQGYSLGLPSRISVQLKLRDGEIQKIAVGGYGQLLEERLLEIG